MPIFKIAVTGSAGSGKSLVCKGFSELGLIVYDCDQIAREVVEPDMEAYNKILEFFGSDVIAEDRNLDRLKLRRIISNDDRLRRELENIMHPAILNTLFSKIEKEEDRGKRAVVVEIPLLFELDLAEKFDFVITVAGDEKDLVKRIVKRDSVTEKDAEDILNIQFPQKKKIEKSDYVMWNTSGTVEIRNAVAKLYQKIKKEYLTSTLK